jgi:hypothetical protein
MSLEDFGVFTIISRFLSVFISSTDEKEHRFIVELPQENTFCAEIRFRLKFYYVTVVSIFSSFIVELLEFVIVHILTVCSTWKRKSSFATSLQYQFISNVNGMHL